MQPQLTNDCETSVTREPSPISVLTPANEESNQAVRESLSEPGICTFWRGRVALYGILKSLGIGPGDSILVPGFTCFAVPAAVLFAGARPLYVDIDPNTFNISLDALQSVWDENPGAKIKAIIIQHTYGLPADLNCILPWARRHGVATIEDCAHAWGSRYRNARQGWSEVGTEADAAFFSSQWTKPVSTGLGGWARANKPELLLCLRRFHEKECVLPSAREVALLASQVAIRELFSSPRAYAMARSIYQRFYRRGLLVGTSTPDEFQGKMPAEYAKQMSGFQLRHLKKQLGSESVQLHRRRLKKTYDAVLESAGLPVFSIPEGTDPVLLRYPIRVRDKKRALAEAQRRGIELGDWYAHPIDVPKGLETEAFAYRTGMCPEGERAAAEVVNMPMHVRVSEKTAKETVDFLKEFA
jgi:perosamine synthetase